MAVSGPVTREELQRHLERLGRESSERGADFKGVTDLFRLYWLALHHHLVVEGPDHALDLRINASWVEEWLKMMRLPPHEHTLPVRTWAEGCGKCDPVDARIHTTVAVPGLTRRECATCRGDWLVLEG